LKPDSPVPDDVNFDELGCESDDEPDQLMELLIEQDHEVGMSVQEQLIPYAVRWYTGEACPEMESDSEDDDDDDDEDDDDDDDDDSEDESDSSPAQKKKVQSKNVAPGNQKEECKQQ